MADVADGELHDLSGGLYIDQWPDNPWTGDPMQQSGDEGDYTYAQSGVPLGSEFTLTGHLSSGGTFVVP